MIPKADECHRKAKEAEALAETARDQAAREILREVAELWRKLADQVEKRWRHHHHVEHAPNGTRGFHFRRLSSRVRR